MLIRSDVARSRWWSAVAAAVAVVTITVAACRAGGDEDGSHDPVDDRGRDGYVAAFEVAGKARQIGKEGPEADTIAEQERCLAEAVVDGVGVEALQGVATPRELAEADQGPAAALADADVELDDAQRDAIYTAAQDCVDLRDRFIARMEQVAPATGALPPSIADCMKENLDDELLREIVLTELTEGDAAFAGKPELTATLTAIGRECATT